MENEIKDRLNALLMQRRYQLVIDELNVAVFEWNLKDGSFYSSETYQNYAISQVNTDDILNNRGPRDLVHPDDQKFMLQFFQMAEAGQEKVEVVLRLKMRDNSFHWCRMIGLYHRDENDKPDRTMGIIIDINEERESSVMLSSLLNGIPGGVAIFKYAPNLECQYFSDGFAKLSGRTRDEIEKLFQKGEFLEKIIAPSDIQAFREEMNARASIGAPINMTYRYLIKNKGIGWLHLSATKLREEDGCPVYYCIFTNPTDETALYRSIAEDSANGIFVAERSSRRVLYMNAAIRKMFGISEDLFRQRINKYEPISKEFILLSQDDIRSLKEETYSEFHVIWKDKLYLEIHAKALMWNGIDAYIMYFSDETAEYGHQMELQDNRMMLDAALASANVLEWRYDFKRKIVTDSGAFGVSYHMPKVIENIPDVFLDGEADGLICEDSEDDFKWLFEHCGEGKRIQRDIHCKSPDGSRLIWQRVIYTPIFDENGNCVESIGTAVDITEQKEREQNYEEQLRLKKIVAQDALAMASYNLTQNRITEAESQRPDLLNILQCGNANDVLREIREYTASDEKENKFALVYDCETILKAFENGTRHIEIRHHLKDNSRWMQSTFDIIANPYTGDVEAISILRDITDIVRAELVVNRLLAVDYEAIVTIDVDTGKAHTFRHLEKEDPLHELFAMQDAAKDNFKGVRNYVEKYATPEEVNRAVQENSYDNIQKQLEEAPMYESLFSLNKNGCIVHKRVMYAYLDESKDVILCAIQDVSDTYEQEEKQKQALTQALQAAKDASRSKSDFLSRMSHDMRTPMNGILGLAELSEQEMDLETLKRNMAQIKESGNYLLSLINDTLDFQRIESGKLTLNSKTAYTKTIFVTMIEMIRPAAEEKGIDFQIINHNADMGWYVYLDPVRIKQIFINLLSNAIKFTPSGGKVIMEIENVSREGMVSHNCIKIIDNGIGMSEDFLRNRLFKPFSQEQNEVSAQYAGSGLGLSIARSLIEMMGGKIEVESKLGVGTTFTIFLDFVRVEDDVAKEELEKDQSTQFTLKEELVGKQVLLVEDHPLNAQIACKLLEKAGCIVRWADNGQKGVEAFQKSQIHELDVILMDIRMPVMNGLEAAAQIRTLEREDAKSIPIIAMTANAYDEDVRMSLDAGMNAHLAKPIERGKLYEVLADMIGSDGKDS